jgi:hypothetical protein
MKKESKLEVYSVRQSRNPDYITGLWFRRETLSTFVLMDA